jgi:hypothetical protein
LFNSHKLPVSILYRLPVSETKKANIHKDLPYVWPVLIIPCVCVEGGREGRGRGGKGGKEGEREEGEEEIHSHTQLPTFLCTI